MPELSNTEKLAIAQAFQNVIGDMVSTKKPGNLRDAVDREMRELYEGNPMAGRSYDVRLLGTKVGTYSLTVSKPTESVAKMQLRIDDSAELLGWAIAEGFVNVDMSAVDAYFQEHGVVPDGCSAIEVVTPGSAGGEITRTTLRIDEEKVAQVMGNQLGAYAQNLLEGGNDD